MWYQKSEFKIYFFFKTILSHRTAGFYWFEQFLTSLYSPRLVLINNDFACLLDQMTFCSRFNQLNQAVSGLVFRILVFLNNTYIKKLLCLCLENMTPPTQQKWKSQHNYAQMASSMPYDKELQAKLLSIVKAT